MLLNTSVTNPLINNNVKSHHVEILYECLFYTKHAVPLQQASEMVHDGVYEHALGRCPDSWTVCMCVPQSVQQR